MSDFDDTRLSLFWHVSASCLFGLVLALVTLMAIETKRFSAVWILCSLITFCILLFSYQIYASYPSGFETVDGTLGLIQISCTLGEWYELEIRRVLFGDTPMPIASDDTRLILFWHVSASCLFGLVLAPVTLMAIKTKRFSAVWILCSLITFCILLFSYQIFVSFPGGLVTIACPLGEWYELEIKRVLFGDAPKLITSDDTLLILFWHVSASCLIGLVLALVTLMAIKPANKEKE
ncbi:hypothetical protein [Gimesia aquarii]|uniref:Uncharacterized protein n=1 Tax=Gimesia aquarii TaxID=2527964 RepID=A0A517WX69_9PLAN|nr:hypothetical protein [Gimesia aquarii]QDU09829.1 hypothetical protein V202x_32260 [Gimesia aquarii]